MGIPFYMDEHVPFAITRALRARGVDVLTVQDERREGADDVAVLDRACDLGRVVFTRDEDFLELAAARQRAGESFPGVVYAHQLRVTIKACIEQLELIAGAAEPAEMKDQLIHLPLRT